jgi:hypothetical protein
MRGGNLPIVITKMMGYVTIAQEINDAISGGRTLIRCGTNMLKPFWLGLNSSRLHVFAGVPFSKG